MDFYSFLSDFLQMCKIPIGSTVVLGTIKKWESTLTYLNMPARFFCHQGVFFCAACSCCSCRKHAQNPFIHFIVFQLFACWCLSLVFWVGCWEVFFYSLFIGDWREFCDQSYHWSGLCVVIIHSHNPLYIPVLVKASVLFFFFFFIPVALFLDKMCTD